MKRSVSSSLVAGLVIIVAVVAAILVNRSNPVDDIAKELAANKGESPAITETIATKIPENSVLVMSTSEKEEMNEWWTFFSQLEYFDPAIPQSLGEIKPDELAYAVFPYEDKEYNYFNMDSALYIKVEGKAVEFQKWLVNERLKAEGAYTDEGTIRNSLPIVAHEDFLIIPTGLDGYSQMLKYVYDEQGKEITVDGWTATGDWEEANQINESMLWADFDSYLNFYIDHGSEQAKEGTMEVLKLASGYEDGTTFLATSKDFGKSWSGIFPTGGLDPQKVDLEAAERKILDSVKVGEGVGKLDFEEGFLPLESILSASTKDANGNIQTYGEVCPMQLTEGISALVPNGEEFKASIVFDPTGYAALFRGESQYSTITHLTLDVTNNNSGRLSFGFVGSASEEDEA